MLEYSMKRQAAQKAAGTIGYSGTRNDGGSDLSVNLSLKSAAPVRRKKVQKTGDVYATIAAKPSGVVEPTPTRSSVIAPCSRTAFAGVLPESRHAPRAPKARKSRPNA